MRKTDRKERPSPPTREERAALAGVITALTPLEPAGVLRVLQTAATFYDVTPRRPTRGDVLKESRGPGARVRRSLGAARCQGRSPTGLPCDWHDDHEPPCLNDDDHERETTSDLGAKAVALVQDIRAVEAVDTGGMQPKEIAYLDGLKKGKAKLLAGLQEEIADRVTAAVGVESRGETLNDRVADLQDQLADLAANASKNLADQDEALKKISLGQDPDGLKAIREEFARERTDADDRLAGFAAAASAMNAASQDGDA